MSVFIVKGRVRPAPIRTLVLGGVRFQRIAAEPFLGVEFIKAQAKRVNKLMAAHVQGTDRVTQSANMAFRVLNRYISNDKLTAQPGDQVDRPAENRSWPSRTHLCCPDR
jgi:hypothetical protein